MIHRSGCVDADASLLAYTGHLIHAVAYYFIVSYSLLRNRYKEMAFDVNNSEEQIKDLFFI